MTVIFDLTKSDSYIRGMVKEAVNSESNFVSFLRPSIGKLN